MDFNNILIRCSAIGKIKTPPKTNAAKQSGELGTTAKSYLRALKRELEYDRHEILMTPGIIKGMLCEEEGITLYNAEKQKGKFLKKNTERINNEYLTGEPDVFTGEDIRHAEEGFDIKCCEKLSTFPDEADVIESDHYWQNMGYMALSGAKKWTTVKVLLNAPIHQLMNEKQRLYYALGCPPDDAIIGGMSFLDMKIEIEKSMIFDMAKFKHDYPGYDIECKEWRYDIPREKRIHEFVVKRDEEVINGIYADVIKCRKWMKETYDPKVVIAELDKEVNATIISQA